MVNWFSQANYKDMGEKMARHLAADFSLSFKVMSEFWSGTIDRHSSIEIEAFQIVSGLLRGYPFFHL